MDTSTVRGGREVADSAERMGRSNREAGGGPGGHGGQEPKGITHERRKGELSRQSK